MFQFIHASIWSHYIVAKDSETIRELLKERLQIFYFINKMNLLAVDSCHSYIWIVNINDYKCSRYDCSHVSIATKALLLYTNNRQKRQLLFVAISFCTIHNGFVLILATPVSLVIGCLLGDGDRFNKLLRMAGNEVRLTITIIDRNLHWSIILTNRGRDKLLLFFWRYLQMHFRQWKGDNFD